MKLRLALPLFLSSADHNYSAALRFFGVSSIFAGDLCLPSMPPNAIRESNRGTLDRLERDLILIDNEQLSPVDAYRFYGYDALDQPFWGYGVEVARMDNSSEIFFFDAER